MFNHDWNHPKSLQQLAVAVEMGLLWFVVLILSLGIRWSIADCPPSEVVHPCTCKLKSSYDLTELRVKIRCEGHDIDLKSTLNRIAGNRQANETHFYELRVINSSLEEIESDVLGNLTFDQIAVQECQNLRRIHWLAFNNTADRLKLFELSYLPNFSVSPAPYNLFDMVNSFGNLEWLDLNYLNVTNIPSYAFILPKLFRLVIHNNNLTVDDKAFYHLTSLRSLGIGLEISYLPTNALQFASDSNATLFLNFGLSGSNKFTASSFDSGWLNSINRPVELNLIGNQITFLNRSVFEPFLDHQRNNKFFSLLANPLNCSDCRNAWLRNGQDKYQSQVKDSYCDGVSGPTIYDSNFDHCF